MSHCPHVLAGDIGKIRAATDTNVCLPSRSPAMPAIACSASAEQKQRKKNGPCRVAESLRKTEKASPHGKQSMRCHTYYRYPHPAQRRTNTGASLRRGTPHILTIALHMHRCGASPPHGLASILGVKQPRLSPQQAAFMQAHEKRRACSPQCTATKPSSAFPSSPSTRQPRERAFPEQGARKMARSAGLVVRR